MTDDSEPKVRLSHGAGGKAMRDLVSSVFLRGVDDPEALATDDGAVIPFGAEHLVVTTDAHVVSPAFFPGGDIGRLAVSGTVNDLAMMGAWDAIALTSAVIVEEGYPLASLERVQASMAEACREAETRIVAGDTKVMRRGELDGIVITTSGLGRAPRVIRDSGLREGDLVIVTGTIGDHGLAVLGARHGLGLEGELVSDVAPLNGMVRALVAALGDDLHAMKDPTRGGVTSALVEMSIKAGVSIVLDEASIPVSEAARAAAELLGIDVLAMANEGKALVVVAPHAEARALGALHTHPYGRRAAVIGRVVRGTPGEVLLDTGFGHRRLVERDAEPVPRIC